MNQKGIEGRIDLIMSGDDLRSIITERGLDDVDVQDLRSMLLAFGLGMYHAGRADCIHAGRLKFASLVDQADKAYGDANDQMIEQLNKASGDE